MEKICNDLTMEQQELDAVVANLDEAGWATMTAAEGWDIKQQIRHLAYIENRARLTASNPEAFKQWFEEMLQDPDEMTRQMETTGKDLTAGETLKWWREERRALLVILAKMDRRTRLPWYGPALSAMSFATARLMETWAHGQDIEKVEGSDQAIILIFCQKLPKDTRFETLEPHFCAPKYHCKEKRFL